MGYTTEFTGSISIEPGLNQEEIDYLNKFAESRRMKRNFGPYYIGTGEFGQDNEPDIADYNSSGDQPSLWCHWVPNADGTALEWDGSEKFQESHAWMAYIIDHFLKPGAEVKGVVPGLQCNHHCNGVIKAQGEEMDDRWKLIVTDNVVITVMLE